MRRLNVDIQGEAEKDLADIFRTVLRASRNDVVAERFIRRIIARCRRIGDAPWGGRPRDDLSLGLRTVPFERSAVIAYRIVGNTVNITNIFYGGRDFEAIYRDSEEEADPAKQH